MDRIDQEWWSFDHELFDGAWIFDDYCATHEELEQERCLARLLVVRVTAMVVRDHKRCEDVDEEIRLAHEYLEELTLYPAERARCRRVLDALVPYAPAVVAGELLGFAWCAVREEREKSARCFSELAYFCASRSRDHEAACAAAASLARLARFEECHRTHEKWSGIARIHADSMVKDGGELFA